MRELRVDIIGDLKKSIQKFLDKSKAYLGDDSIVTILKEGDIAQTILNTAEELNADIIVMGSHSRKWLENIIMGSEAADVLKKTTIPLFMYQPKNKLNNYSG